MKGCKKTIATQKDCVRFATFLGNVDRFEPKIPRAGCSEEIKLILLEDLRPFRLSYKKLNFFRRYGINIAKIGMKIMKFDEESP